MLYSKIVRIPQIYRFFSLGLNGYIVMENIKGLESTIEDMESFLGNAGATLDPADLLFTLCHLDVSPRVILWLTDGTFCLLDWESVGFYPRLFEVCEQQALVGKDGNFNRILLDHMKSLTAHEEEQVDLLLWAYRRLQRYHLYDSYDQGRQC